MSVYMLIESKVIDAEKYRQYIAQVPPIIARHGGRFLVRGGKITPLSDAWKPERIIIVEFPSEAHIKEWLSSPEYQHIAPLREAGAETRAVILEGFIPTVS
jgi:uncharacterized protein (DUF1330 family)